MYNLFIGIDPGQNGGIAIIRSDKIIVTPITQPGNEVNSRAIADWIKLNSISELTNMPICYIELVHSMPGQGVSSVFKFGFTTGMLHGIVRTLGIPLKTVTPQAWKKLILAGTDKSKQAAIDYCLKAYPDISLLSTSRSKKFHDGMAESLLIAEYAKRIEK
jgi:crossover junction endodeoxyribonuclease RuvC